MLTVTVEPTKKSVEAQSSREPRPTLICCRALAGEIGRLKSAGKLVADLEPLPSGLCTRPAVLRRALREQLSRRRGAPALVAIGDCCPDIDRLVARFGCHRLKTANCFALLIGDKPFAHSAAAGTFFLLPEWAPRWRKALDELGIRADVAPALFRSELRQAIYLDTQTAPFPRNEMAAFETYTGLPVLRQPVSLDLLGETLDRSLRALCDQAQVAV